MPRSSMNDELLVLIKELMKSQAEVLKVAMETQKSQAEVLNKWLSMFQPQTPNKSTTEEERIAIREQMEAAEWDPIGPDHLQFPS